MNIHATISNSLQHNRVTVATGGNQKEIVIPGKSEGQGSSINGGELLFLALATCFCNDIYREAAKRNVKITSVDVRVSGEFGKEGEAGKNITYSVDIQSPHSNNEIQALINYVDTVAEIHNTLRQGVHVALKNNATTT